MAAHKTLGVFTELRFLRVDFARVGPGVVTGLARGVAPTPWGSSSVRGWEAKSLGDPNQSRSLCDDKVQAFIIQARMPRLYCASTLVRRVSVVYA